MMTDDIRWRQRFQNFQKALKQLDEAVALLQSRALSNLEKQGIIQAFEYTYELAWNVIKDFYQYQGEQGIQGSRDAIRLGFKRGLIEQGDTWLEMVKTRALTSHTYHEALMQETLKRIETDYLSAFLALQKTLTAHLHNEHT